MFDGLNLFLAVVIVIFHSPPHAFTVSIGCCLFGFSLYFKSALLMVWRTKPFSCFWHADTSAAYTLIMPIWCQDLLNKTGCWS